MTDKSDNGSSWIADAARQTLHRITGSGGSDIPTDDTTPDGTAVELAASVGEFVEEAHAERERTVAAVQAEFTAAAADVRAALTEALDHLHATVATTPAWVGELVEDVNTSSQRVNSGIDTLTEISTVSFDSIRESLTTENQWAADLAEQVAALQDREPGWAATLRTGLASIYSNLETPPEWLDEVRGGLLAVRSQIESAVERSERAAASVAEVIAAERHTTPEWAEHLDSQVTDAKTALDDAISQIANITSAGLASMQEVIESQPDVIAQISDITSAGVASMRAVIDSQPDVAGQIADQFAVRPDWAAGLAESIRDIKTQIAEITASSGDEPVWAQTLANKVDNKTDDTNQRVDNALARLDEVLGRIDESLTLNAQVASTTLETVGKVLDGTVDQVKEIVDIEPGWVRDVLGAFDAEPGWVSTQRDELAKMTNWLGRQNAASADQVIATLNEFIRQAQPLLEVEGRLTRIEELVAQTAEHSDHNESQVRLETLLTELSELSTAQTATSEQILAGVDDLVSTTSGLADLSVDGIASAVDDRLGVRFDTLDTAVAGFGDKFASYDTRFETLNAMIAGVVAVVERTADQESKFIEDQADNNASTRALIDTVASTVEAMSAQVLQLSDEWSVASETLTRFGSTSDGIETQVTNLAQFADTTLAGLLSVLERNEDAMSQVVESVTGPDDLRTHLAELRSAIGGMSRDIQRINANSTDGGGVLADQVVTALDQIAVMKDELSLISDAVHNAQSRAEVDDALREVRAVRDIVEGLQASVDAKPGSVPPAVAADTDMLVDKVNQVAATLTELRLVAAGHSEKLDGVGNLVETVRDVVDDMYTTIGPAAARMATPNSTGTGDTTRPRRRERPLRAS